MQSKNYIIVLIAVLLGVVFILLQKDCTGKESIPDVGACLDTIRHSEPAPALPADTLEIEQPVRPLKVEGKQIRKPVRQLEMSLDTVLVVKSDEDADSEVIQVLVIDPVAKQEPVESVPDSVKLSEKSKVPSFVWDVKEEKLWNRQFHLKTNALGWGMGISNLALEMDIARHWSFALPVYYSAWNYFDATVKFRTFAVQPELRYWCLEENQGFFVGVHVGLAYYNVAWGGEYRYQDHNRNTPAIGGGVSVGYCMPLDKDNRWKVEFSLGAGVYALHYDKFHNTPDTKNGLMVESNHKKTYFGFDQASVSFLYKLDFKGKGGKR